jgi:hypothetical protein
MIDTKGKNDRSSGFHELNSAINRENGSHIMNKKKDKDDFAGEFKEDDDDEFGEPILANAKKITVQMMNMKVMKITKQAKKTSSIRILLNMKQTKQCPLQSQTISTMIVVMKIPRESTKMTSLIICNSNGSKKT